METCPPPTRAFLCFSIALLKKKKGQFHFFSVMLIEQIFSLIVCHNVGESLQRKLNVLSSLLKDHLGLGFIFNADSIRMSVFFHSQSIAIQQLYVIREN